MRTLGPVRAGAFGRDRSPLVCWVAGGKMPGGTEDSGPQLDHSRYHVQCPFGGDHCVGLVAGVARPGWSGDGDIAQGAGSGSLSATPLRRSPPRPPAPRPPARGGACLRPRRPAQLLLVEALGRGDPGGRLERGAVGAGVWVLWGLARRRPRRRPPRWLLRAWSGAGLAGGPGGWLWGFYSPRAAGGCACGDSRALMAGGRRGGGSVPGPGPGPRGAAGGLSGVMGHYL
jgi:hypothetical protein